MVITVEDAFDRGELVLAVQVFAGGLGECGDGAVAEQASDSVFAGDLGGDLESAGRRR
jgi:hypothetical protein